MSVIQSARLCISCLFLFSLSCWADDKVINTDINVDVLKLILTPLTEPELAEIAQSWQLELQKKAQQVVELELQILRNKEDLAADIDDTEKERLKAVKERLFIDVTDENFQQQAISDRLNIVLNQWELKGGEIDAWQQYRQAEW